MLPIYMQVDGREEQNGRLGRWKFISPNQYNQGVKGEPQQGSSTYNIAEIQYSAVTCVCPLWLESKKSERGWKVRIDWDDHQEWQS